MCGAIETVVHVVVDCPRLRETRQQLRTNVGDAFNRIATMPGGQPSNGQGKASNGGINREVLKCSPGCPEIALAYIYPRIGQPLCSTSHPGDLHAVYPIAQELLYAQN